MPNYTLTTDLIADCMALIPQNLERLKNDFFSINIHESRGIEFEFDLLDYGFHNLDWYDTFDGYSLFIISHCLRTIPEFQEPNPKILKKIKNVSRNLTGQNLTKEEIKKMLLKTTTIYNRTIASATLHGQGEFPPSTLEELCESYKNVMSK